MPLKRSEYNAILSKNKKRQEFKEKLRKYTESYTNPKKITDTNETARFVEQTKPVQTGGSPALTVESNPAYINNMSGASARQTLAQNAPYGKVFDKDAFMRQQAISAVTPTTIRSSDNFTANALQRAANSAANNIAYANSLNKTEDEFSRVNDEYKTLYNSVNTLSDRAKSIENVEDKKHTLELLKSQREKMKEVEEKLDALAQENPDMWVKRNQDYYDKLQGYTLKDDKGAWRAYPQLLAEALETGVKNSTNSIMKPLKDFGSQFVSAEYWDQVGNELKNLVYGDVKGINEKSFTEAKAEKEAKEHDLQAENEKRTEDMYKKYGESVSQNKFMQLPLSIAYSYGEALPYVAISAATGGVLGLSGAAQSGINAFSAAARQTPRYISYAMQARDKAKQHGTNEFLATAAGALEGANQTYGDEVLGGFMGTGTSLTGKYINVTNPLLKSGMNAAGAVIEEGLEEVGQDIFSAGIERMYNPDVKLDAKELLMSGLAGSIMGVPGAVVSIPTHFRNYKSDVQLANSYINAVSSIQSEQDAESINQVGDNIKKQCDEWANEAKKIGGEAAEEAQKRAENIKQVIENTQNTMDKNKDSIIANNKSKKSALDNVVNNSKGDVAKNLANLVDEVSKGNNSGKNDYKATVDYILSQRDDAQAKYQQAVDTGDEESIKQYATDYAAYAEAARQLRNNQKEVQKARSSAETYGDVTAEETKTATAEAQTTAETTENAPKTTEKQESFTEKSDSIRETTMKDMGFLGVNKDIDTAADDIVAKYGSYKNAVDKIIEAQKNVREDTTISDEEKQTQISRLQDIIRSIRNRNTARQREAIENFSKIVKKYGLEGVEFIDVESDDVRSSPKVNGYYDPATKKIYVSPYSQDIQTSGSIVVHELTHHGATADHALVNDILKAKDTLVSKGQYSEELFDYSKYETTYKAETEKYINSEDGKAEIAALVKNGMTEEQAKAEAAKGYVNEEIAAHFMQEVMSNDDALKRLAKEDRPLLKRILDAIVNFFSGKKHRNERMATLAADKIRSILRATEDVEVDNSRGKKPEATKPMQNIADENAKIGNTSDNRRFSLTRSTEEAGDLIAVHNVTEDKLDKILSADGMPMPSIAVAKADIGHSDFGNISLVFSSETVDPKANRNNKVYSADVWSPTFPSVEYEVNQATESRIVALYNSIKSKYGSDVAKALYPYYANLSSELDSKGGAKGIISSLSNDTKMMNVFLADTGETPVKNVVKETSTEMTANTREMGQYLIDTLGKEFVNEANPRDGETAISARNRFLESHEQELRNVLQRYYENNGIDEETAKIVVDATRKGELMSQLVKPARSILSGNTTTTSTTIDYEATNEKILDTVDKKQYKEWLNNLFGDAVKNEGIRNGKDPFTPSGNRRSFSATHYPVTLDNIVKAMRGSENVKGATTMTENAKAIRSASAEEYKSIDAIHKNEGRLQKMSESEITAQWDAFDNRLYAIIDSLMDSVPTIDDRLIESRRIGQVIIEASRNPTESNIRSTLEKYSGKGAWYKFTDQTISDIQSLVNDIREAPTNIFEAKPERVVGLDEVKYAVVPDDLSKDTVRAIADKGIEVRTYESGNEESRLETLNKLDGVRFSKDVDTDSDPKITQSDIEQLRSIGRKSISDFTHEDIQKSEKWAKKFYSELGAKSPFFRAWFGDWRANDTTTTNITSVSDISAYEAMESMPTGTFTNKDSDWNINVGAIGKRDTNSHSGREKISVKMLSEIQTIIENAVLLDTEISEKNSSKKHNETLFMHKLYAPVDFNGELYVAKVTVEEYGAGDSSKRFYNLRGIKIDPAGGTPDAKTSYGTMPDTRSTYSISDLYSLVKSNDKDFKENPASKVVNKDGTPKVVYHYTNGDFTVFNTDASGSNQGKTHGDGIYVSTSPTEFKYAGKNRMELYADIKNPFEMELTSEQADYILDKYASKKHDLDAYDGMYREHAKAKLTTPSRVFDYLNEYAKDNNIKTSDILSDLGYDGVHDGSEWVAFSSEQLKSATDNIGTFDKSNPDIRQSKDVFTQEEREKIISKGYTDYLTRQFVVKDKSGEYAKAISMTARKKLAQQLAKPLNGVTVNDALAAITPVFETIEKADGTPEQRAAKAYEAVEKAANTILGMVKDANTNPLYEQYSDLRTYLRTTKLDTSSVKADIADYNEWRKSHMGSMKLGNDGMQIDSAYQELSDMYPEFFPADIVNPADQLVRIGEVSDKLKKVMENPILSQEGSENIVRGFANAILAGYENSAETTLAAKNKQSEEDFARFVTTITRAYETDVRNLSKQLDSSNAKIEKMAESIAKKDETGRRETSRKKALSGVSRLQKAMNEPTLSKNIPESWKKVVETFLKAMGNEDYKNAKKSTHEPKFDPQEALSALAEMQSYVNDFQNSEESTIHMSKDQIKNLEWQISGIRASLEDYIHDNKDNLNAKDISLVTSQDANWLANIADLTQTINHLIKEENELFIGEKKVNAEQYANEFIGQIRERGRRFEKAGEEKSSAAQFVEDAMLGMENASTYFHILGDHGDDIIKAYRVGQNKITQYKQKYVDRIKELVGKNFSAERTGIRGDLIGVEVNGESVNVSKQQLMSIYALWHRPQARRHMETGGVYFLNRNGQPQGNAIVLNQSTFDGLMKNLTEQDIRIAKGISDFLSTECASWGNETSMELYGYKKFNDPNYFPINVHEDELAYNLAKKPDGNALERKGFTKRVDPNSTKAIDIRDIFDVADRHVEDMSMYAGYAPFNSTLYRIVNAPGFQATLREQYGKAGVDYLLADNGFLKRINGMANDQQLPKALSFGQKMANMAKKAAVSFNFSTAAKQPLSYFRAWQEIEMKYLAAALKDSMDPQKYQSLLKEMNENSGIARIKSLGYSDVGMGRDTRSQYSEQNFKSAYNKGKYLLNKFDEIGMYPAGQADEHTWVKLWNACKMKVEAEGGKLSSQEALRLTTEKFNDVIGKTQVVDSVLDTAPISNNSLFKTLSPFMNEPIKTLSSLYSAWEDHKKGKGSDKLQKAAVSLAFTNLIIEPILSSMIGTFRDKDDEDPKEFWQEVMYRWTGIGIGEDQETTFTSVATSEMAGGVFFAPVISDIYDVFTDVLQGFSGETMTTSGLYDIGNATIKLLNALAKGEDYSGQKSITNLSIEFITSLAQAFGIPANTLRRDINAAIRTVLYYTQNIVPANNLARWQINKIYYNLGNKSARTEKYFYDILVDAYNQEDKTAYNIMREDLDKMGIQSKEIVDIIEKRGGVIKPGSSVWNTEVQARFDLPTKSTGNKVEQMVTRVYTACQKIDTLDENKALPKRPDKYYYTNDDGDKVEMTTQEYDKFVEDVGVLRYKLCAEMAASNGWSKLNAEQQLYALTKAYDFAARYYRQKFNKDYNSGDTWMKELYGTQFRNKEVATTIISKAFKK